MALSSQIGKGTDPFERDKFQIVSCEMVDLWERTSFKIKFDRRINFLIGNNGTGKTTLMNFINCCLSGNIDLIRNVKFGRFELVLTNFNSKKSAVIRMEQSEVPNNISFTFKPDASEKAVEKGDVSRLGVLSAISAPRYINSLLGAPSDSLSSELLNKIRQISNVMWLSVHRGEVSKSGNSNESAVPPVDSRLNSIERAYGDYFREILAKSKSEGEDFQRKVFLSFLDPRDPKTLKNLRTTDVDSLTSQLRAAFRQLNIPPDEYEAPLRRYRDRLKTALPKTDKKQVGRSSLPAEINLISLLQVTDIIAKWKTYQGKINELFVDLGKTVNVLNGYFRPKVVDFDENGNLIFNIPGRDDSIPTRKVSPLFLSSGEKQLYILLMEALLQKRTNSIYLADEPELSLHVKWQEKLVESIIDINPQAQIIFATHSPDIVGPFQKNIIDLGDYVDSGESIS